MPKFARISKHKRLRFPRIVRNWVFTWPRQFPREQCELHLTNDDIPRNGNNSVHTEGGTLTLTVNNDVNSVFVELKDIPGRRVQRVVIRDENFNKLCTATNGTFVVDGDYGPVKN